MRKRDAKDDLSDLADATAGIEAIIISGKKHPPIKNALRSQKERSAFLSLLSKLSAALERPAQGNGVGILKVSAHRHSVR
jgi:hypothetical protein